MLSIINKFAVKVFPYPSSLTGLQYATSAAAVFLLCVPQLRRPQPPRGIRISWDERREAYPASCRL